MRTTNPIVTAIIPVFNGARFLAAAVESIAQQAEGRVRAVLVDDGSTDSSPALIARLAAEYDWIVALRHETNRGVAAARNTGLRTVATPFIAFLDQDDHWAEGKLDLQLAVLAAEPELDFIVGRQLFHLAEGIPRGSWVKDRFLDGPQPGFVFSSMILRRHCFERTGLLHEDLRYGVDDIDWIARSRAVGLRHRVLEEVVLHRTLHDSNLTRMTAQSNIELLRVMRASIHRQRG